MVGIGESGRSIIESTNSHDIYTLGEFKNDQLQSHTHSYTKYSYLRDVSWSNGNNIWIQNASTNTDTPTGRTGTTTHGKQVGVNYCIKYL